MFVWIRTDNNIEFLVNNLNATLRDSSADTAIKGSIMPTQSIPASKDFAGLFTRFLFPSVDVSDVITTQQRNYDAIIRASQLVVESANTVLRRQIDIFGQLAEEGSNGIRDLWSINRNGDRAAYRMDLMGSAFEKSLTNIREISEIIVSSNKEATGLLAKRLSEGLTEFKMAGRPASKEPNSAG